MSKSTEDQQPPRSHGKKAKPVDEEATWRKPDYRLVEASMEITAYYLTR